MLIPLIALNLHFDAETQLLILIRLYGSRPAKMYAMKPSLLNHSRHSSFFFFSL